ncbi:HNH endonuclease signature motif containing protein [Leisingera sp. F5]|uniref:HNH endonuclease signature motif containing protein n=1 Tax=Leisingera sp. F5 TaxID=1813816 RepID=UPI0025C19C64|nr:HNH endonuclease signature motif containing protein [Leisingera sp. F5]
MARLKGLPKRLAAAPRAVGYSDRQAAERARNRARAAGNSLRRLYSTKPWRDLRLVILERAGWMCQGCDRPHLLTGKAPAPHSPVVDHIEPHRGNLALFWDESNLQAVCKAWHDSEKQRQEKAARPDGKGEGWG